MFATRLHLRVLGWLLVGLLLLALPARAWVQMEYGISWPDGTVPMVLMFGPNKALADGTTWNLSAQLALDEWNRNMGRLQFTSTTSTETTGGENNYVNEVFFAADAYGDSFGTGTLAVTIYWSNSTRITRADVLFNNKYTWDSYRGVLHYSGTTLVPEFRRVALHEFGHVLGFDHPDERNQTVSSVMNASISGLEHLTESDAIGAATVYSPGVDNPAKLPVIMGQPESQSVVEGSYASFAVGASSIVPLSYQWLKDGVAVSGATTSRITFSAAKLSDTGDYAAQVSNSAGTVTSQTVRLTVRKLEPPTISIAPKGGTFVDGGEASLVVYASGTGLVYQWRRDDVPLTGAVGSTLSFKPVRMWDAANYDVVVSNPSGSVTSGKVALLVRAARPATIVSVTGSGTFQIGQTLSISASALGDWPITYVWKRDGTVVGQSWYSLSIEPADESHAGTYTLTVTNAAGSETSAPIRMAALPTTVPVLTRRPVDLVVEQGRSLNLSAWAIGSPSPTFVWRKDGAVLADRTQNYLQINPATAGDAGLYSVVAVNRAGTSAEHAMRVTVQPRALAPVFVHHPASVRVSPGDSTAFTCQLYDSWGATYRWYKDGVPLPNSNFSYYSTGTVSAASVGDYFVEATLGGLTTRSGTARLELSNAASRFEITRSPASATVYEGALGELSIALRSPADEAPPTVQWYRDGTALAGANGYVFYPPALWRLGDAGKYSVKVTLGADTLTSAEADVRVLAKPAPMIVDSPPNQTVNAGEYLAFSVTAEWEETYQWKKDGVALPGATERTLTLGQVTAANEGDYTVVVSNRTGSAQSTAAHITVLPGVAPTILRQPEMLRTSRVSPLVLSVVANGSFPLTYQWWKDGVVLPGATSRTLDVGGAGPGAAGRYRVVVANAFGSVESESGSVLFDGAVGLPIVTQQPQNSSAVIGRTAVLTAVAWGDPIPSIQWRKNGANIAGATKWKLELPNSQLSDSGSYDAVITNSLGSVTTQSAQLTVGVDNGRIVALSARAQVGNGGDVLIPGFLIGGSTPKKLLLRALGPTLTGYGVQGALADPKLVLKALGSDTVIASNDDWSGTGADPTLPALFTQVGASTLTAGSKDAALVATLAPGLYTAITSGADGGKGVALLEVFDVDPAAGKLTGISTRAIVGTGSNVLIPGIVVDGPVAKKLLIRVSGPALAQYGVQGTLADPKIELKSANGTTLQLNDNWDKTDTALTGAIAQIGLGAFADGSKDAALLATLNAGLYTIVISGADGGSGVALVEVYDVP